MQRFVSQRGHGNQPREFNDLNFDLDTAAMQVLIDTDVPLSFAPWEVRSYERQPLLLRMIVEMGDFSSVFY